MADTKATAREDEWPTRLVDTREGEPRVRGRFEGGLLDGAPLVRRLNRAERRARGERGVKNEGARIAQSRGPR